MSSRKKVSSSVLQRGAKHGFWAFDTALRSLLPLVSSFLERRLTCARRPSSFKLCATARNLLHCGTHGGGDSDGIGVISRTTLYPIAWRQECVKALDEIGVTGE